MVTVVSLFLLRESSNIAQALLSIDRSLDLSLVFLEVLATLFFVCNGLLIGYLDSPVFLPDCFWNLS